MKAIRVHETAFMTAYYRSQYEEISQDPYSYLWLSERTKSWCDEYLVHTAPTEIIAHAIRNRYFHEQMLAFSRRNETGLIINLGAGFSMYPYRLPEHIRHVEVDQSHVVQYKNEKTKEWQNKGQLPQRQVERIACDLSDAEQLSHIFKTLKKEETVPTFILIEGVFFYLKLTTVLEIFALSAAFQHPGDCFGAVTFEEGVVHNPIYKGLVDYFGRNGDFVQYEYTNPPHSFYENIKGYSLKERSSVLDFGKEKDYFGGPTTELEVLNEYFYMLER